MADAVLTVTSYEEYTAKIVALQQACLTPLKEDLADWLNKIMNLEDIKANNFMNRLDNGVIICRLAKVISNWCDEHLKSQLSSTSTINNRLTHRQIDICLEFSNNAKIWEDAKSKTFYARDNVCNFIRWSKEFGVNQSVLFESDDLVLHANPRQVVLCLLDVARIACVKYGFTEAPGLVRFEQEIDRELAAEMAAAAKQTAKIKLNDGYSVSDMQIHQASLKFAVDDYDSLSSHDHVRSNRKTKSMKQDLQRKHDEYEDKSREKVEVFQEPLTNRYDDMSVDVADNNADETRHKVAGTTTATTNGSSSDAFDGITLADDNVMGIEFQTIANDQMLGMQQDEQDFSDDTPERRSKSETGSLLDVADEMNIDCDKSRLSIGGGGTGAAENDDENHLQNSLIMEPDSLSSHYNGDDMVSEDRVRLLSRLNHQEYPTTPSCIPTLIKRTNSNCSIASNQTIASSDLSSSQSSTCHQKHRVTSDLDGKVMRIAKSYYGKQATKGVTRLSEGKYRIAERIVFVRLLKGQHVMVRIGGGWDTLQNFLFRHKSDPSQVIDPDDLLPLDAKIMLEKDGPQLQAKQFTRQAPSTPSSSSNLNLASSYPATPTSFNTSSSHDSGSTTAHNNINNTNNILSPQQQIITNSSKPTITTTTSPIIIHGSHNGLNHNQMHNYHQISQQQQHRHETNHQQHQQLLSTLASNNNNNNNNNNNSSSGLEQQSSSSSVKVRKDSRTNNRNTNNPEGSVRLETVKSIEQETTNPVDYHIDQDYEIGSHSGLGIDTSASKVLIFGSTNNNTSINKPICISDSNNILETNLQQNSNCTSPFSDGFTLTEPVGETSNNITITTDGENSNATNSNKTSNSSSPLTPKLSYGTDGPTSPSTTATSTDMDTGLGCSIASSTTTANSVNLCNYPNNGKQISHHTTPSNNNKSSNSVNNSNLVNNNPNMNNYKYQKYMRRSGVNRMQQYQQNPLNFNAKDYLDSRQKLYNDQRSRSTSENVSDIGSSYGDQQNTQPNGNTLRNLLINGNNNGQSSGPTNGLKHGRSQQVLIHRLKASNSTFSKSTLSLNGGFGGSSANLNSPANHRQIINSNAHMIYGTPMHTYKSSRYPNYLKSSQHITNRAKQTGVPS